MTGIHVRLRKLPGLVCNLCVCDLLIDTAHYPGHIIEVSFVVHNMTEEELHQVSAVAHVADRSEGKVAQKSIVVHTAGAAPRAVMRMITLPFSVPATGKPQLQTRVSVLWKNKFNSARQESRVTCTSLIHHV
jgi:hypothetical protein